MQVSKISVLHLNAGNDTNGNPRRLYLLVEPGRAIGVVDEGYSGPHALDEVYGASIGKKLRDAIVGQIGITPGEYRELKRRMQVR